MIDLDSVSKRYPGGHEALQGVSLHVDRGELVLLTGHSGAGKSTLLRLIALMEAPSRGKLIIDDQDYALATRRKIPYLRRKIGIVLQNPRLLSDRTVFDNVSLPLIIAGYPPRDTARRVRAALDKVGLLSRERDNPVSLSGGEQQRVGIARALVAKPKVLLADEPTGNLDPDLSREIMDLFIQFQQVGVTAIVATHDLDLIEPLPYRRLILTKGRLQGTNAA